MSCVCYSSLIEDYNYPFRYSVPEWYIDVFRKCLKTYLRRKGFAAAESCDDVLRHKGFLLHPEWFRMHGIPLVRIVQKPGEYIVTFPRGYHFGVNLGFNVNEACNFATPSWIDWGKVVSPMCSCPLVSVFYMFILAVFFVLVICCVFTCFPVPCGVVTMSSPCRRNGFVVMVSS